jgi:hypothetical protein
LCARYALDELVDPVGIEVTHLRDQARAADRRADELLVGLAAEDGQRRVRIEATMIGPESISVPSRSKRTTDRASRRS